MNRRMFIQTPDMENRRFTVTTLWNTMKNFFNNNLYETVTRTDLLNHLFGNGFDIQVRKARNGASTIDTYRNYLEKAGYMRRIGRGIYRIIDTIPEDLSIRDAKTEAYGIRLDGERTTAIRFTSDSELRKAIRALEIGGFGKRDVWDTREKYPQEQEDFLSESEFQV